MVEQLNKRPSGGSGSRRNSRRRRPRSPSPMSQTTPTDNEKLKNHKPTQSNSVRSNGVPAHNTMPPVPTATSVEVIEIDSSSMIESKGSSDEPMDVTDTILPIAAGSGKDPILPDPQPPTHSTDSNSVNERVPRTSQPDPVPNTDKDSVLSVNRKRTPSPTSFTHLPPSKRFQHNPSQLSAPSSSSLKPVNSDLKSNTGKSPSPSPLLAPPTAPPTIRPSGLLSSASQVLNEEFKKKQMTENLKIKQLITKEIRKHSKSKDVTQHRIINALVVQSVPVTVLF